MLRAGGSVAEGAVGAVTWRAAAVVDRGQVSGRGMRRAGRLGGGSVQWALQVVASCVEPSCLLTGDTQ